MVAKTTRHRQIGLRVRNKLAQRSPNSRGIAANVLSGALFFSFHKRRRGTLIAELDSKRIKQKHQRLDNHFPNITNNPKYMLSRNDGLSAK